MRTQVTNVIAVHSCIYNVGSLTHKNISYVAHDLHWGHLHVHACTCTPQLTTIIYTCLIIAVCLSYVACTMYIVGTWCAVCVHPFCVTVCDIPISTALYSPSGIYMYMYMYIIHVHVHCTCIHVHCT